MPEGEAECKLTVEDGWWCGKYTPGPDGKCLTPRPKKQGKKRTTCGHLRKCHDLIPQDESWKQD